MTDEAPAAEKFTGPIRTLDGKKHFLVDGEVVETRDYEKGVSAKDESSQPNQIQEKLVQFPPAAEEVDGEAPTLEQATIEPPPETPVPDDEDAPPPKSERAPKSSRRRGGS